MNNRKSRNSNAPNSNAPNQNSPNSNPSNLNTTNQNSPRKFIESNSDLTKALVTAAAAIVFIIGLRSIARDLITPILLATFVSMLLYPIFKVFRRIGLNKYISLLFMMITIIVLFIMFGLFLAFSFNELSNSLGGYIDNISENVSNALLQVDDYVDIDQLSTEQLANEVPNLITEDNISRLVSTIIGSLGNIFYLFFFIPFIAIVMILQFDSMPKDISKELADSSPMVRRFQKFASSITVYVISRGKVNLFTGALFAVALALIGIEFAILWGILVAILSFIPYLGIVIASIPPVLLAFATGGWVTALLVIVAVLIVNVLAENVLDPYIQGQSSKITTLTVILALIFWTWLLGPVGGLMSVPLTVLLKLILQDFEETKWVALVMEGNYSSSATEIKKTNMFVKAFNKIKSPLSNND